MASTASICNCRQGLPLWDSTRVTELLSLECAEPGIACSAVPRVSLWFCSFYTLLFDIYIQPVFVRHVCL